MCVHICVCAHYPDIITVQFSWFSQLEFSLLFILKYVFINCSLPTVIYSIKNSMCLETKPCPSFLSSACLPRFCLWGLQGSDCRPWWWEVVYWDFCWGRAVGRLRARKQLPWPIAHREESSLHPVGYLEEGYCLRTRCTGGPDLGVGLLHLEHGLLPCGT